MYHRTLLYKMLFIFSPFFAFASPPDTLLAHQYFDQAQARIQTKQWDAISVLIEKTDQLFPDCDGPTRRLAEKAEAIGDSLQKNNRYTEALETFELARKLFECTQGKISAPVFRVQRSIGVALRYEGRYADSEKAFQDLLDISIPLYGPRSLETAKIYGNLGILQSDLGWLNEAAASYQQALSIKKELEGTATKTYLHTSTNLAVLDLEKRNFPAAKKKLTEILQQAEKILSENDPLLARIYSNLASIASYEFDFERAISYHQKAIAIKIAAYGETSLDVAENYANLAAVYYAAGDLDTSEKYNDRSLTIKKQILPPDHPYWGTTYFHLGSIYTLRDSFARAQPFFEKSIDIFQKIDPYHYALSDANYNLGYIELKKGNYDRAQAFFDKSLRIARRYSMKSHGVVSAYFWKAQTSQLQNRLKLALSQLDSAIIFSGYRDATDLSQVAGRYEVLEAIILRAQLLVYQKREYDPNQLWAELDQARKLEEVIRQNFQGESSKLNLQKLTHSLYEMLLTVGYQAGFYRTQPERLLELAEASKAVLLLEGVKNTNAKKFGNVPPELLAIEDSLLIEISYLDGRIQAQPEEPNPLTFELTRQLLDTRSAHQQFIRDLEIDFPGYYNLKYEKPVAPPFIRDSLLQPKQGLLEFFVGDSVIYAFLLNKEKLTVQEIKRDFPLEDWIAAYLDGIESVNDEFYPDYVDAGFRLYQKLLSPFGELLPTRLMIIPDGILNKIPFEALLTAERRKEAIYPVHTLPFLIHKHQISYCYSANMWNEMRKSRKDGSKDLFLGLAPFGKSLFGIKDEGICLLPQSVPEVNNIRKIFGQGEVLLNRDATKLRFLDAMGHYDFIHLSTHVIIDTLTPRNTRIIFAPGPQDEPHPLYLPEIYNYTFDCELIFLSVCQSNFGKLEEGEGVMSLTRALAYAGAKSVVANFWQTLDAASVRKMVEDFYFQLWKQRKNKDEALRTAKINFINQAGVDSWLAHPYHWAGFVLVGDMNGLDSDKYTEQR